MLQGTWQSTETGATYAYSKAGGFLGGKTNVRVKNTCTFIAYGTYQSQQAVQHKASPDNDGVARNYQGNFTFSEETMQLTGRDKDDPGVFACWMEAGYGGLAFVVLNRKFTGQRYMLFKVN